MVKWFNLLEEFAKGTFNYELIIQDNGKYYFEASSVLNLDISINTKYGFLVLSFNDNETRNKFLQISNIHKITSWHNDIQHISTTWDESIFPSRVFVEKSSIMFYDEKNNDPNNIKFEKRVLVIKNIMKKLVDIKFDFALEVK